jgi:hypothetical protein
MIRRGLFGAAALSLLAAVSSSGAERDVDGARTVAAVDQAAPAAASGAEGIRAVDFGDVAQPGSACSDGLRYAPPTAIDVAGGVSQVLDLAQLTQLTVDPEVTYGDLDGDGADEAVVHVTCAYGANGSIDSLHVWGLDGDRLVHVAGLDEPGASSSGGLPPAVEGVSASDEGVTVTWSHYADGDANCCPSEQARLTYTLDGDRLEPAGDPVISAVRP